MDRLDAMAVFVAAVDRGSLAAASRQLGHSPASVTRAITSLEDRLGAQLLHRTSRALRLTPPGETYLVTCRQVLDELQRAELGAAAEANTPRGLLTLTAPVLFGRLKLRPVLDRFLDANPAVQARLVLLDRVVSMLDEGIDVATRLAHLPDSGLHATRLGEVRRVLCASPVYIERHGQPGTPADLANHACITSNEAAADSWSFARDSAAHRQRPRAAVIRPRLIVNAAAAAIDSALEGHGLTRVLSYQIADDVAANRLVLLLEDYEPPPVPVHFVMQADRTVTAKLRAFIDFAAPVLRTELARSAKLIGSKKVDQSTRSLS
jgi:DNA-binding transcriptional LysR family regulator